MKVSDQCLKFLSLFVFIGLLGAVYPVFFNEGSAMAKYLARQKQLELVNETAVEDYMSSELFGDGSVTLDDSLVIIEESERNNSANKYFMADTILSGLLLLGALLLLFPKLLFETQLYHILLVIALWLILQSLAVSLNGGKKFSELAFLAHATRWGMPLVLWWGISTKRKKSLNGPQLLLPLVLICCSLTFAVHGWEAFSQNPTFQDLLYNFSSIFGWKLSPTYNEMILEVVGCMDIALAASLLIFRNPKIFLWMAIWGILTALSRPITLGLDSWPEAAVRIANGGLPFILFYVYTKHFQETDITEINNPTMEVNYEKV